MLSVFFRPGLGISQIHAVFGTCLVSVCIHRIKQRVVWLVAVAFKLKLVDRSKALACRPPLFLVKERGNVIVNNVTIRILKVPERCAILLKIDIHVKLTVVMLSVCHSPLIRHTICIIQVRSIIVDSTLQLEYWRIRNTIKS